MSTSLRNIINKRFVLWLGIFIWGLCTVKVAAIPTCDASNFSSMATEKPDSLTIHGQIIWKDSTITGFPAFVQITATSLPHLPMIQAVDSLGRFEKTLAYGSYNISPQLHYHWMEEEWVRIDEEKSSVELRLKEGTNDQVILELDTIPWPQQPVGAGILTSAEALDGQAVDSFVRERMAFFEIPGATLSLIKDGQIIYSQTYGVTHSQTREPVTSHTLFETGSITKLVAAFAVMRLYEKGQIDLDKPLHTYLENDEINDERYPLMTARHVLCHQSGMSNWPKKDENGQFQLNFTPGTQYGYSGKAYEYLKLVLEAITHQRIDTILKEEVLDPLGITDMHFKGNETIAKRGAHGHKKYVPSDIFMPKRTMIAYTLQTTSPALAKFALALYQRKGLRKETYEEMFKIQSTRSDGTHWGLGVRIEHTPSGVSYGHSGSTSRGFISNLVFYDESGLGYVILTNSQMGGWLSLPLLNEYLILGN
ncbi:MAG: serine hydrolase domain-containing protein [Bacteroidota bacterium]